MIANGDLGEIRHVNIANIGNSWADPGSRPKGDWWSRRRAGRRAAWAPTAAIRSTCCAGGWARSRWVTGAAPVMVPDRTDKTTGEAWTATADDVAWFTLEMAGGALAQVFMSGVAAHNMGNLTQVFGSKGTITLVNDDEKLWFAKAGQGFEEITEDDPNAAFPGLNKGIWNVSVVAALQELCAAIPRGGRLRRGATFADGLAQPARARRRAPVGHERRWVRPEDVHA
jgi:predicted dehydrogenase